MESNPLRFLGVLQFCVSRATQFDMPEADREVEEFLHRFESKYGHSPVGKDVLEDYRREVESSRNVRKTGGGPWKLGHAAAQEY